MSEQSQSERDASDWDDLLIQVKLGIWIAPVVIVLGWLVLALVRAMTGWTTPIGGGTWAIAWLWGNGGLLAAVRWSRRNGRWPIGRGRWLDGDEAHRAASLAVFASLASFIGFFGWPALRAWLGASGG